MRNFSHLNLQERNLIEEMLNKRSSIRSIAKTLNRHTTTITNEIRKNYYSERKHSFNRNYNNCDKKKDCTLRHVCARPNCRKRKCADCEMICNRFCGEYLPYECKIKNNPPYVCNGCHRYHFCGYEKRVYKANKANKTYLEYFSESRNGFYITEEERNRIEGLISPLIQQGHSVYHAHSVYKDEIMFSSKTLYNYINAGIFPSIKRIDLPRAVRYKKRNTENKTLKIDKKCRLGRKYKDFEEFLEHEELDKINAVQLDTVIGKQGGKCLLTILFPTSSFMLMVLREANTSQSVIDAIDELERKLGIEDFKKLFLVCLTDNGSEFSNPERIECSLSGELRTNLFYCNPNAAQQKGSLENNHEFIRKILPKGTSFNELTQEDVVLIQNHINSYNRKKLNGKCPYEVFESFYGSEILKKLGVIRIPSTDIVLKPSLLK